jgi:uncharacterized protein YnzC (UPF0291/DUF896 family)
MEQKKLDRINELAKKVKDGISLTEGELAERTELRREFLAEFRQSFGGILENTYIERPDGTREKLKRGDS